MLCMYNKTNVRYYKNYKGSKNHLNVYFEQILHNKISTYCNGFFIFIIYLSSIIMYNHLLP